MNKEIMIFIVAGILMCPLFVLASIGPVRSMTAYLYGPFLPGPNADGNRKRGRVRSLFAAAIDATHVASRLTAVYLSCGILSAIAGINLLGPGITAGVGTDPQAIALFSMGFGIAAVALVRIFSVLQSTSFLVWVSFLIIGAIGIYLPLGTIVFGAEFPKFITDVVFQGGATSGLERLGNVVDRLIIPGAVVSFVAVVGTELAVKVITNKGLTTAPLGLFEEYRCTFMLHEQRFSRKQVTSLYINRLKKFGKQLISSADEKEICWVTYSATSEILDMLSKMCTQFDKLKVRVIVRQGKYDEIKRFVSESRLDESRFAVHAVPEHLLPCPRFMLIGETEVIAAMPVPPRDLNRPTAGSSNLAFRSTLPDCVSRFKRVFRHLWESE